MLLDADLANGVRAITGSESSDAKIQHDQFVVWAMKQIEHLKANGFIQ